MATLLLATADISLYETVAAEMGAHGHEVVWAANGKEAYDAALDRMPDAVLLDMHLPVFNALETCELLRGDPEVPRDLPIILLSDDALDPRQVERVAATGLFPKTHMAQDLSDLLVKHLGPKAGG